MKLLFWTFLLLLVFARWLTTTPVYKEGQKIKITATITEEPIRYSYYQKISLAGFNVYLPPFPEISYGDRVVVIGKVENKKLVNAVLVGKEEKILPLSILRETILNVFRKSLPEPHAALVAGITLGAKSDLPTDFWDSLKKTGTAHVVVASGMNVTLVASFIIAVLLLFLPRRKALPVALLTILGYVALSGFDAPILRAAIMGTIAFTAQELGRVSSAWRALLISGLIMLIIYPQWISDLGFILSFVATGSMVLLQKKIGKALTFIPDIFKVLREDFSTTLAAQIGVAPILFITFGQFNILSPLINTLILWTIPLIMIIGAIGGLVGLLLPALGRLILYLSYPLTWWFINIVKFFS